MSVVDFDEVVEILPSYIKNILIYISNEVKDNTYEMRLRINKPIVLFGKYGSNFVKPDSTVSSIESNHSVCVNKDDLNEIINVICGYSMYSHQNDIAKGFVTFGNGHRVGFCGTAIIEDNQISGLRDIDSVNIRIARNVFNSVEKLLETVFKTNSFHGIIIAGAPCTGKTTVLKSIATRISSEFLFGYMKTVLIDERYELGRIDAVNCDILRGFSKTDGINHAIRVLSPDVIICDEIITDYEADEIIKCCYSGVKFIVSVHAESKNELILRSVSRKLIKSGFFNYVGLLSGIESPGEFSNIVESEEILNEFSCNCNGNNQHNFDSF